MPCRSSTTATWVDPTKRVLAPPLLLLSTSGVGISLPLTFPGSCAEMAAEKGVWQPGAGTVFRMLLVARLVSAFCMHISDCDETFNYWEPVSSVLGSFPDHHRFLPLRRTTCFMALGSRRGSIPLLMPSVPMATLSFTCSHFWSPTIRARHATPPIFIPVLWPLLLWQHPLQIVTFYLLRIILAAVCALCELYLYRWATG